MTQGYFRVVNIRGDKDFQPKDDETLIMMDRTNKILGNRHVMRVKSFAERERVIAAFDFDLMHDIEHNGPMWASLMSIANRIALNDERIAGGCWCLGAACHVQVIERELNKMIINLRPLPNKHHVAIL